LQVLDPGSGYRDREIHPIQKGTGDPAHVSFDLPWLASTPVPVRIMTTGTGIAGPKQDKSGRIAVAARLPHNGHLMVLQRLPQQVQLVSAEFREFVQKEYAPVCQ
jgi:hypothetical protein